MIEWVSEEGGDGGIQVACHEPFNKGTHIVHTSANLCEKKSVREN